MILFPVLILLCTCSELYAKIFNDTVCYTRKCYEVSKTDIKSNNYHRNYDCDPGFEVLQILDDEAEKEVIKLQKEYKVDNFLLRLEAVDGKWQWLNGDSTRWKVTKKNITDIAYFSQKNTHFEEFKTSRTYLGVCTKDVKMTTTSAPPTPIPTISITTERYPPTSDQQILTISLIVVSIALLVFLIIILIFCLKKRKKGCIKKKTVDGSEIIEYGHFFTSETRLRNSGTNSSKKRKKEADKMEILNASVTNNEKTKQQNIYENFEKNSKKDKNSIFLKTKSLSKNNSIETNEVNNYAEVMQNSVADQNTFDQEALNYAEVTQNSVTDQNTFEQDALNYAEVMQLSAADQATYEQEELNYAELDTHK